MTLKRVTHAQAVEFRNAVEAEILEEVNRQFKGFLNDLRRLVMRALRAQDNVLLAAGSDEMPTLGEVSQMWTTRVDTAIMAAITAAYERVFRRWSDQGITMSSPQMSASRDYIAQVRDRLVRGTHMRTTVYDESFDKIRLTLALANAESWSRGRLATRIAAELSWDKDSAYWRAQLEATDTEIDSILDALGEPGTPAREFARENDPRVNALRTDRNNAIKHIDANGSIWRERATLIARTEATGAGNFGALQALTIEGVLTKKWMATEDTRTRETHRIADDQEVPIAQPFLVGTSLLQFPGDPLAPVDEVANCRCTIIGGEDALVASGKEPKDGDGDGMIDDGKPSERPASPKSDVPDWVDTPDLTEGEARDKHLELDRMKAKRYDEAEHFGVDSYLGNDYWDINFLLRDQAGDMGEKTRERTLKSIDNLDWAFGEIGTELPEDIIVKRGVNPKKGFDPSVVYQVGEYVVEPGYSSTSLSPHLARGFMGLDGWEMNILVPKGAKPIVISVFQGELETILPRDSRFKIVKVDKETRKVWMELET